MEPSAGPRPPLPGGIFLSRPVVLHMGPGVGVDFGVEEAPELPLLLKGMMGSPFGGRDIFDRQDPIAEMEREMQGFLQGLEAPGGPGMPGMSDGGFSVNTEQGHFTLNASLPGYKYTMHAGKTDGTPEEDTDQPLSVEVVGRSLVVRGQQTNDRMTRSFQRSFRLPRAANADAIKVTYNVKTGALAVDIPAKEGATDDKDSESDDDVWAFDSHDGGSQTTMTFVSGGPGGRGRPAALRGARDPFESLINDLMGIEPPEAPERRARRSRSQEDDPIIKLLEQLNGDDEEASMAEEESKEDEAEPVDDGNAKDWTVKAARSADGPRAKSQESAPVVVHPQHAQSFWRLVDGDAEPGAKVIEVVAPKGVHAGKPEGNKVPVYNKSGADEPIGRVELPVDVREDDCSFAARGASKDRVLRCGVDKDAVKKVPIRVVDEL